MFWRLGSFVAFFIACPLVAQTDHFYKSDSLEASSSCKKPKQGPPGPTGATGAGFNSYLWAYSNQEHFPSAGIPPNPHFPPWSNLSWGFLPLINGWTTVGLPDTTFGEWNALSPLATGIYSISLKAQFIMVSVNPNPTDTLAIRALVNGVPFNQSYTQFTGPFALGDVFPLEFTILLSLNAGDLLTFEWMATSGLAWVNPVGGPPDGDFAGITLSIFRVN